MNRFQQLKGAACVIVDDVIVDDVIVFVKKYNMAVNTALYAHNLNFY